MLYTQQNILHRITVISKYILHILNTKVIGKLELYVYVDKCMLIRYTEWYINLLYYTIVYDI